MRWYLIKTKPRQEFRAKEHLENQSFAPYLPVLTPKNKKPEPLFPGYIFIAAPEAQAIAMGSVRSTRGVLGFVRFGHELATATDAVIEEIRSLEDRCVGVPRFRAGQGVECKSGPLAGLRGIFEAESGEERCIILLNLLNSARPVQVRQSDLQAL